MTLAVDSNNVAPRATWTEVLGTAAGEVFTLMVGITVGFPQGQKMSALANVTGTVGIAGAISAIFSLRCSSYAATKIASLMLAVPVEKAASQHCDAVGEICNMIAGHFKAKIGLGDKCMLSVPTVIIGSDYQLRPPSGGQRLEIPLLYEGEILLIALDIRP